MRRTLLLVMSAVLVIITVFAVGCTGIAPPASPTVEVGPGIVVSQQNTGIWVTGEGKVTVVPDIAILSLGVEAQAATVAEAQSQAVGAMDAVMKELNGHGVAEKDIKTQRYSIYPVRRWDQNKNEEILIGYRVTNTVTAKIRKVDDTGAIIDAVAKVGGDYTRINSISFAVDEPSKYHEEAREKAIADAEAKAEQLADLTDVRLGKPTYINESGGFIPVPREYAMKAAVPEAPAPTTPISPGETEIQLTVQVVYSIK
ncbi:unnamed protein product [marine sediment metagenome]|uniref:26 kDa periplasmic immunogenic protein n=1 Tax=marine sediment metagenome TaxID=412755 RepID=X0RYJ7_9ZZZZ